MDKTEERFYIHYLLYNEEIFLFEKERFNRNEIWQINSYQDAL